MPPVSLHVVLRKLRPSERHSESGQRHRRWRPHPQSKKSDTTGQEPALSRYFYSARSELSICASFDFWRKFADEFSLSAKRASW